VRKECLPYARLSSPVSTNQPPGLLHKLQFYRLENPYAYKEAKKLAWGQVRAGPALSLVASKPNFYPDHFLCLSSFPVTLPSGSLPDGFIK
jgi:hypothetical protein